MERGGQRGGDADRADLRGGGGDLEGRLGRRRGLDSRYGASHDGLRVVPAAAHS